MTRPLQLSMIAFSPCTSNAIIKFCESKESGDEKWYFGNVKSGMESILMHRKIFFLSCFFFSISSMAPDQYTFIGVSVLSGALMCYSLMNIYSQAKKIQSVIDPYLKVSCCTAAPKLTARAPTAGAATTYGTNSGASKAEDDCVIVIPKKGADE